MPEPNPSKPTPSSSGAKELLGLGLTAKAPWQPGELKVLLQDELASPLEFELGALPTSEARQVVLRAKAQGLLVRSLGELLRHPKPPLELLVLAKDYFKRNESHPGALLCLHCSGPVAAQAADHPTQPGRTDRSVPVAGSTELDG